jgi:hypothetical protein
MNKPLAWSFTALSDFRNCPRQYHHKRVLKDLPPEVKSEAMDWGNYVHEEFDKRQSRIEYKLPANIADHETYMTKLDAAGWEIGRIKFCEAPIALDHKAKPIASSWRNDGIWYRGKIDFRVLDREEAGDFCMLVDYKTGKKKDQWDELAMFAIHTFLQFPHINLIDARYYWTVDKTETRKVWGRADIPTLWNMFLPDLKQYALAFKTDTWQPRPSGLCHGWCPVKTCEHWRPMKEKK